MDIMSTDANHKTAVTVALDAFVLSKNLLRSQFSILS
jgi:hypothetical protein